MNRLTISGLVAASLVAVASPAYAAQIDLGTTSVSLAPTAGGGTAGSFTYSHTAGKKTTVDGAFLKTFSFFVPVGGALTTATLSTNFAIPSQNIDFVSILLNGTALDILRLQNGRIEFGSGSDYAFTGANTLSVIFNAAGNGAVFSGDITVAPVPEPATWGLMILGLGIAGYALRRNRQKVNMQLGYSA